MIFKTFTCPYAKTHSLFLQRRLTRNRQCSENTVKVLRCQTFSPSWKMLDYYSNIKGISENVKHCMFPSIVKNPENPPQPSAGNLLWILSVTETETISIQCFFITKSRFACVNPANETKKHWGGYWGISSKPPALWKCKQRANHVWIWLDAN